MSYVEHFNLTDQPFRLTPDPAYVYWSKQHARAKAYMESTIWLADGFVVITGEIGSGKTTLLSIIGCTPFCQALSNTGAMTKAVMNSARDTMTALGGVC